jgi:hypothetical protein
VTISPALQAQFLRLILPRVKTHGRVFFRHLKCRHRKAEAIAEMIALSWKWFIRLVQQGKDPALFPTAIATYAARAVHSGRKLAGMERAKDVLSPLAQARHGFVVGTLPDFATLSGNPLSDALTDNTQTPPDEQVAFRLDFPAWLRTRTDRDRRVIQDLMVGERTAEVAARHGLTAGRVSQLRRDFLEDWHRFCGEPRDNAPGA